MAYYILDHPSPSDYFNLGDSVFPYYEACLTTLLLFTPFHPFVLCTKRVDLWKLLLPSLCFSGIVEFPMHSMEISSQLYSPILL